MVSFGFPLPAKLVERRPKSTSARLAQAVPLYYSLCGLFTPLFFASDEGGRNALFPLSPASSHSLNSPGVEHDLSDLPVSADSVYLSVVSSSKKTSRFPS